MGGIQTHHLKKELHLSSLLLYLCQDANHHSGYGTDLKPKLGICSFFLKEGGTAPGTYQYRTVHIYSCRAYLITYNFYSFVGHFLPPPGLGSGGPKSMRIRIHNTAKNRYIGFLLKLSTVHFESTILLLYFMYTN